MYNLESNFNIQEHKKHYIHYLEVVIFPDGHVEYAIPSHQEKLIQICCEKLNVSREELYKKCPEDYYFDFIVWLCTISECVSVWTNFIQKSDKIPMTNMQYHTLEVLKQENIYEGDI